MERFVGGVSMRELGRLALRNQMSDFKKIRMRAVR